MQGFINLHKSQGWTSHDCVAKVRRLLGLKKVGHGGTLDPAATGVLPIAIGRATRLLQYLPQGKAYQGTIRFGIITATDDLAGEILTQTPASQLTLEAIKTHLPRFIGTIEQIPPRYSAIQVQGQRLYDLARQGQAFEVPSRTVEIEQIQILHWQRGEFPELTVEITCGAGTYIRSIARDLGAALGVGGTLAQLIRLQSAGLHLRQSITLETLAEQIQGETFEPIDPVTPLQHLPTLSLPADLAQRWCHGQKLPGALIPKKLSSLANVKQLDEPLDGTITRVHNLQGNFLGIGEWRRSEQGQLLAPKLVMS